jgi:hypothetical protein
LTGLFLLLFSSPGEKQGASATLGRGQKTFQELCPALSRFFIDASKFTPADIPNEMKKSAF